MVRSHFAVILALLALHFCGTTVHANTINEVVDGPISAETDHVIDGNTISLSRRRPGRNRRSRSMGDSAGLTRPSFTRNAKSFAPLPSEPRRLSRKLCLPPVRWSRPGIQATNISAGFLPMSRRRTGNPAHDLLATGQAVPYNGGHRPAAHCRSK